MVALGEYVAPDPDETVAPPTRCCHATRELRRRIYANDAIHYHYQCVVCGQAGNSVKRATLTIPEMRAAPAFDEQLEEAYRNAFAAAADRYWAAQGRQRRAEYDNYIASSDWARKRELVLQRDGWECQARMRGCRFSATDVHHIRYDHLGNEPLYDLIAVCRSCHNAIETDKRERMAAPW